MRPQTIQDTAKANRGASGPKEHLFSRKHTHLARKGNSRIRVIQQRHCHAGHSSRWLPGWRGPPDLWTTQPGIDFHTEIPQPGVGKSQSCFLGEKQERFKECWKEKKIPASPYHHHKRIEKQKGERWGREGGRRKIAVPEVNLKLTRR